jgi:hypothetical protein
MAHRGVWTRRCWRRWACQGAESKDKNSAVKAVADAETPRQSNRIGGHWVVPEAGTAAMVHIAAVTRCRPVMRVVTAGQPHAWSAFEAVMATLRIVRPGQGRRRTRPDRVLRRQGLLLGRDPHRAARPQDQGHDPQQCRRDHRPSSPGQQRRRVHHPTSFNRPER